MDLNLFTNFIVSMHTGSRHLVATANGAKKWQEKKKTMDRRKRGEKINNEDENGNFIACPNNQF